MTESCMQGPGALTSRPIPERVNITEEGLVRFAHEYRKLFESAKEAYKALQKVGCEGACSG